MSNVFKTITTNKTLKRKRATLRRLAEPLFNEQKDMLFRRIYNKKIQYFNNAELDNAIRLCKATIKKNNEQRTIKN